ncbi:Stealth CR1 domain-containing protein [Limnohabitans sp. Bal53]|uniref:Stealth CR1 domain-containing protein n=1 Tax=Limnohabitans sp. Bal53 TaxID=1977910 RepID=UPI000D344CE2|nr:Stealth CR1 domain-containing protein [Limnohabitans sp. Bal53]PUE41248.1 exopolysaccharide phosphotransferase [Limnohabitans sp. Bal53]
MKNSSSTTTHTAAHSHATAADPAWVQTPDAPIDVVYLWVDGNDSSWRAKREAALAQLPDDTSASMARYSNVEGRFRDNHELRYSLRALEKFFPQHGHVYIVTDAQAPDWLRPSERLTLVDHRELMPEVSLPTFDSGHIESWIHHIPGLSERYFYFNDDVFLGAPLSPADWFTPEGFYLTWSDEPLVSDEAMRMDATSLENACRLSIEWLRAQAGASLAGQALPLGRQLDPLYRSTFRTFAHSPRPMRRSLLLELEGVAPELFAAVRSTVFRSWDKPTIVSDFVLRWALAHGLAQMRTYRHRHVSTGDADQQAQLQALAAEFGALDFFCINDTTDDAHPDDPRLRQVQSVLQAMLPMASGFEQWGGGASCQGDERAGQSAEIHQGAQAPAAHQSPVSGSRRRA